MSELDTLKKLLERAEAGEAPLELLRHEIEKREEERRKKDQSSTDLMQMYLNDWYGKYLDNWKNLAYKQTPIVTTLKGRQATTSIFFDEYVPIFEAKKAFRKIAEKPISITLPSVSTGKTVEFKKWEGKGAFGGTKITIPNAVKTQREAYGKLGGNAKTDKAH